MAENKKKLEELKRHCLSKAEEFARNIGAHIKEYGEAPCDYLEHQRNMYNFYRGKLSGVEESLTILN